MTLQDKIRKILFLTNGRETMTDDEVAEAWAEINRIRSQRMYEFEVPMPPSNASGKLLIQERNERDITLILTIIDLLNHVTSVRALEEIERAVDLSKQLLLKKAVK